MEEPCSTLALPGLPCYNTSLRLDNLCTDVLLLVFENLHPAGLSTLACVCRRFNDIVTPMIYHTVPLDLLLDEQHPEEILSRRQGKAFTYTRQLFIGGDIKQDDIKRFLANTKELQSVKYTYSPGRSVEPICPWKQVYDMEVHLREGNARLYIDNFTLTNPIDEAWKIGDFPLTTDFSKSLVSLKMGSTQVLHSESALDILKKLLLRTPILETFHYMGSRAPRVPGRQFIFEENQRLPPFRELMLKNYDWKHDAGDVKLHWDFSRIRSLALLMIPVYKFLESVPFSDLAQLQHLHVEDYSEAIEHENSRRATEKLYALIKEDIRALQTLNLTCFIELFHIDALLVHAQSLTSLVFRNHHISNNLRQHRPVLNAEQLTILSKSQSSLESLEIDIDHRAFPETCLLALCQFPRLHSLVLHTQTVIQPDSSHRPGQDPDLTRAYDCFTLLVRQRPGPTKWQRVVINVGGWRERVVNHRAGRKPRIGHSKTYTYYGACVSQRYFVLEESASGQEDLIYEELPPKDEGLTHFHGNLRTGRSFVPQTKVEEDKR
ncbi:hypothetical protein GE21DRAFT_521 [Neurospora crassa]|nr:hypothetical protein GE21DRAFT_521 [Neurospora crassa]